MIIINGAELAKCHKKNIKTHLQQTGKNVSITVINVGHDPASEVYVRNKKNACQEVGIKFNEIHFEETATQAKILEQIARLNKDSSVNAVMVQLPLPKKFDEDAIIQAIDPIKDVDCLTDANFGKILSGAQLVPCTARGVMDLIKVSNINLEGKIACIIGRNKLAGRSIEILLNNAGATTILCHSKTPNITKFTKDADIVVSCVGKASMLTGDMVKDGAVLVDVGISRTPNGLRGDFDFETLKEQNGFLTPVPGGVGPMTVVSLLKNAILLHDLQAKKQLNQNKEQTK